LVESVGLLHIRSQHILYMRIPLLFLLAVGASGCKVERLHTAAGLPPPPPPATVPLVVPEDSEIPRGPEGVSIRRGRALLRFTGDSLPQFVGNGLTCINCHLEAGERAYSAPWVGVYGRFPQYRSRNARLNVLGDRINDCFQRSLAGKPLPFDGPDMADIIAYMAFMSRHIPNGARMQGEGFAPLEPLVPDTARGQQVFADRCVKCHGDDGLGTKDGPPLWGPRSFTIAAGMARLRTAAAFIYINMPDDRPGTLTQQEAFDVAAYVTSRPRPDFPGKEFDWPNGDPPPDVPYQTRAARAKADSGRSGT
jgi:thiosulfate dehydrogenase